MSNPPLRDFLGLVELGVVDHDREEGEVRRRVRAIECLQQVAEEAGLLALPHTRSDGPGAQIQSPGQIALLVGTRRHDFHLLSLGHPLVANFG